MHRLADTSPVAIRWGVTLTADDLTGWTIARLRNVRATCEHALDEPALLPSPANRLWLALVNAEIARRMIGAAEDIAA